MPRRVARRQCECFGRGTHHRGVFLTFMAVIACLLAIRGKNAAAKGGKEASLTALSEPGDINVNIEVRRPIALTSESLISANWDWHKNEEEAPGPPRSKPRFGAEPSWSAVSSTPCIQVLTFDRAESLHRLLSQLNKLDYGTDAGHVWLQINIDAARAGASSIQQEGVRKTVAVANGFEWLAGVKTVRARTQSVGTLQQWLEAWDPEQDRREWCVVLEDDTLPSVHAWTWTRRAFAAYASEPRIFSLGWQRPTLVPARARAASGKKLGRMPPPWKDGGAPFLFRLLSTWGFVAIRTRWRCFLRHMASPSRLNSTPVRFGGEVIKNEIWLRTKPPGAVSAHHIFRYMEMHNMYTLYPSIRQRESMCANMRERGANFKRAVGADFPPLTNASAVELSRFPLFETLRWYGWDANPVLAAERSAVRSLPADPYCPSEPTHGGTHRPLK